MGPVVNDRAHDPECLLCRAERISPWHHEDDVCWIADCVVCATPMVVWRGHGIDPSDEERGHMLAQLDRVATAAFGASHGGYWEDGDRRSIPDHWHVHGRPKDGFFGPGGGPHNQAKLTARPDGTAS